jgi:hypothetical protein
MATSDATVEPATPTPSASPVRARKMAHGITCCGARAKLHRSRAVVDATALKRSAVASSCVATGVDVLL